MGCALFGGICATGTIARTATNVRSGAVGPVSGMLHAAFLLVFMLFAAPLAALIPLAALAGLLAVVAWGMAERHEFWETLRRSRGEALVLLATFLLTVFRDLTEGIVVGVTLGSLLFMHRMTALVSVQAGLQPEVDDGRDEERSGSADRAGADGDILVCHFSGPLFFGAAATVAVALERIGRFPGAVILDFSSVPFADSSMTATIEAFVTRARAQGAAVLVAGATPPVRHILQFRNLGLSPEAFAPTVAEAQAAAARLRIASGS
jgi:SulP family sulfate permease